MKPKPYTQVLLGRALVRTSNVERLHHSKFKVAWIVDLDLLLEVVPDPHAELVELVPLLGQANDAVLSVPRGKQN